MPNTATVCVGKGANLEYLVDATQRALGIELAWNESTGCLSAGVDDSYLLMVGDSDDFDDLGDIEYSQYGVQVDVDAHNTAIRVGLCRKVFETIKADNKHRVLLVDNVTEKLDEWIPTESD